ncbi:MAG: hypothetical protein J6R40_01215 [Clostridia bacterium]|nr:hypothetical protein [Clostridia bacterium]
MENNETSKSISVADLFEVFKKAWIAMVLVAVVVGALGFVYANMTYVEEYTATSKYAVLTTITEKDQENYGSANYSMDLKAVKDVEMLLQTHYVINQVIDICKQNPEYTNKDNLNYKSITRRMSITTDPELTRFIILKIKDKSTKDAEILSQAVCDVIRPVASDKLKVDVNDTDVGVDAERPSNGKYGTIVKLLPFVMAAMMYVLFFVIHYYDDKIKTEEDVSRELGLNLLGVIPNIENSGKIKSRYYKKYNGGRYYRYGVPMNTKKGEANRANDDQ